MIQLVLRWFLALILVGQFGLSGVADEAPGHRLGGTAGGLGGATDSKLREQFLSARRLVVLGDSITAAGDYVAFVEAWLLSQKLEQSPLVIDAGLPSETVSGLSEEGHAGGAFPRPNLHERLDRLIGVTQPDLIVACYGINCGIYAPRNEARFTQYREGILRLREKAAASGAAVIHLTPPAYDDHRAPHAGFVYNEVLTRYSDWLVSQREQGWLVIDLHRPMTQALAEQRAKDAQFTFQPDGVHPNQSGHWFIARQLIRELGDESIGKFATPAEFLTAQAWPAAVLDLLKERLQVRRDAYVGAAGHQRPGIAPGLPIEAAERRAEEITTQIQQLIKR